jgi:signal transduction histidine kinase
MRLTRIPYPFRGLRLSTRLGFALTGILVLATAAQALVYFRTRDETLAEADASYQTLAKALEVGATQIGPEGWTDAKVLETYKEKLSAKGLRDIRVTRAGQPLETVPTPGPGKKRPKPAAMKDIVIKGVVGEGTGNHVLQIPLVIDGKFFGWVEISYELENVRAQLAENFRRRVYALLGVFALGLAWMLIQTHNATRPIEEVADAAARVADGDLSVSVPVERDDEIGRLASTFNRMTEKLRERQELESRLANAEKRAEIGHLASGLAHEIKNPLNALSLGLDVLRRRHRPVDEAAAKEYSTRIETLREEINRLATLINNFLAFGRPLSLTLVPVDVASLVDGTLADLAETAAQARVDVASEIDHELPRVQADGSLLKSAVWNLVQNGIQAMERTGGTLSVTLRREDTGEEGPARVALTVSDSGPGIAPEDLPHLFEPYFSRKEGGLGLGLAMVKRIVQEHGGRVEVENRAPEGGAVFRLTLPLTGGTLPA